MKEEVNIFKKQIVGYQLLSAALAIGLISMFGDYINVKAENEALRNMNELLLEIDYEQYQQYQEYEEMEVEQFQEVVFTNYHRGDGSSTNRVGANTPDGKERLTTDYFEVNENGWYTYEGKVVCATATTNGLDSSYGVLANYNEEVEGINYYTYYDEFEIEIDGKRYEAICLDTCSASHDIEWLKENTNGLNIVDIFVVDEEHTFGKVRGKVYGTN